MVMSDGYEGGQLQQQRISKRSRLRTPRRVLHGTLTETTRGPGSVCRHQIEEDVGPGPEVIEPYDEGVAPPDLA